MHLEVLQTFEQGGIPRQYGGALKLLRGTYPCARDETGNCLVDTGKGNRTMPKELVTRLEHQGLIAIRE